MFCHNNPWVSIAETVLGNGDRAFDLYRRICPAYQENQCEIRRSEPYCYAQTVAARASANEGEAKNSWLTGTAAWTFVNISQHILGLRPTLDGLSVIPCLPEGISELQLTRRYRGAEYHIHVCRTGEKSVAADGQTVSGVVLPIAPAGAVCQVEVTI